MASMPQRPASGDFSGSRDRAEVFEAGDLDLAQERYSHSLHDDRRGSKLIVAVIAGGFVVITLAVLGIRAWGTASDDKGEPSSTAIEPSQAGRFEAVPAAEPNPSVAASPDADEPEPAETSSKPEPAAASGRGDDPIPVRSGVADRAAGGTPRAAPTRSKGSASPRTDDEPAPSFADLPKIAEEPEPEPQPSSGAAEAPPTDDEPADAPLPTPAEPPAAADPPASDPSSSASVEEAADASRAIDADAEPVPATSIDADLLGA